MKATEWMVTVSHRLGPGRSRLASIHRTRSRKRARRLVREARRAGHSVGVMQRCPGCPWTRVGEKLRRRGQVQTRVGGVKIAWPAAAYVWHVAEPRPRPEHAARDGRVFVP